MAEYDLLILNGLVVTHEDTGEYDIAVKDGKIAKIVPRGALSKVHSTKTIDAQRGYVMVSGFLFNTIINLAFSFYSISTNLRTV